MDKPTEQLKYGQLRTVPIPITSNRDMNLVLEFKERTNYHVIDSRRFLHNVYITFKDKIIVDDIIDVNRFTVSLRAFTDRKSYFQDSDIFFTPVQRDNIKSLQCIFDTNRYINMIEAMQMIRILQEAFTGYSKAHLYDKYTTQVDNFKTKQEAKNYSEDMLRNIKIIDN